MVDFPAATLGAYLRGKADCLSHRLRPKDLYHVACVSKLPGWAGRVEGRLSEWPESRGPRLAQPSRAGDALSASLA